jgi:Streptomyces sporulation and cell division protein, SsgA
VTCIQVGKVEVSRRTVALFAAATMTLGGVAFTYAVPVALALDVRFVTSEGLTVGLLIGLTLAFLGNTAATALATPQRKVPSRMTDLPTPHTAPIVQGFTSHGYLSTEPHIRDELSLVFTYQPHHPYSVLIDISTLRSYDRSVSDSTRWEVSREVLHEAVVLGRPSGIGDFHASTLGTRRMKLRLTDPRTSEYYPPSHYDMYVNRARLRGFLLRTLDIVPLGQEADCLDIDGQLEKLLAY